MNITLASILRGSSQIQTLAGKGERWRREGRAGEVGDCAVLKMSF